MWCVICNRNDAIVFNGTLKECENYMQSEQLSEHDFRIASFVPGEILEQFD